MHTADRTVYLHIGRGKTGTTAIQRYLAAHHEALLAENVHYVCASGGVEGSGHQDFAKSFIKSLPYYMKRPGDPASARQEIAQEITRATANSIVLSSENLEMAEVGAVRQFFDELPVACNVKIIFFVRSQDELAEAEYNQLVKVKRETRPFADSMAEFVEGYDFMEATQRWEEYFGRENIICRIYDASGQDVVRQFLSVSLGLDSADTDHHEVGQSNPSIGFKALTVARLLNSAEIENREQLYESLFKDLAKDDLPALMLDSEQARQFRQRFAESNRAFTRCYLGFESSDLGGRRFSDQRRDEIRARIIKIGLDPL